MKTWIRISFLFCVGMLGGCDDAHVRVTCEDSVFGCPDTGTTSPGDASGDAVTTDAGVDANVDAGGCQPGFQDNDADGACEPVCDSQTCSGNGDCDDSSGAALCTCEVGWSGDDCATVSCDGIDCAGDGTGTCDASGALATCLCDEGFQDNNGDFTCDVACVGDGSVCDNHGTCEDDTGAIDCTCDRGYSGADCSVTDCEGIDCGGFGTCDDSTDTPFCVCDSDYQDKNADLVCAPACDASSCSNQGACDDSTGTAVCTCEPGWGGADCSTPDCSNVACGDGMCDASGAETVCKCDLGYQDANADLVCEDVNECATDNGGCDQTCMNEIGTFSCSCTSGYTLNADGSTCDDINECLTNNGGCGDAAFYTCTNNVGAAPTCADINECLTNNGGCGDAAFYSCTNNVGAAPTCADINECLTNNGGCGDAAFYTCTNNVGAVPTCADINECLTDNGGCGDAAFYSCTNNVGGAPTCADINECLTDNGGCGDAAFYTCTNNVGAAPTCADINECLTDNGGCGDAAVYTCTNNVGAAPTCGCTPDYQDNDNNGTCELVCDVATCGASETCFNVAQTPFCSVLQNGDFGTGDFTSWTTGNNPVNASDTTSTYFVTGGGRAQNVASSGPSARVLYQDIAIPAGTTQAVFRLNVNSNSGGLDPANVTVIETDPFDAGGGGDQNAFRIDFIDPAGDVYYTPILFTLYAPTNAVNADVVVQSAALDTFIASQAGNTLRLRIAQVESTFPWTVSVDDVALSLD